MSAPEWERVERALDLALDLPPEDWPAFLDEHCAGDPALRQEVESLLQASETPDALLDRSPRILGTDLLEELAPDPDADGFGPGDRIDRYEIVRFLGRGGQGSVYLADRSDGVFDKQVAVKVVKRGMITEDVLTRFRDERQILADLEHPNIAGILDGGVTEDGLPYLVMELAEGEPLDDHCDRARLGVRARLELFFTVCEAVHYAHSNLVLHRDLKPGNILVTGDGQVKLLDFGIARVMESTGAGLQAHQTQAAIPRLTPEYAAPEQVQGLTMTTATDVYALGVVLYELLTGERPYVIPNRSLMAVQRVVCEVEPPAPSRAVEAARDRLDAGADSAADARNTTFVGLRDALRGDLDAIVMKALEKEPDARYQSAQALARDIRRHFEGRTVEARPHTRWYRTSKFLKRNALTSSLVAGGVLALVAGLGASTWQWREAQRQNVLRVEAAERAEAARNFMVNVFRAFDPDELQGREMTPEILIDRGLSDASGLDGQPRLQQASLNALGRVALNLAEVERADSIFSAAAALADPQTADTDLDLAESLLGRGEALRNLRRPEESIEALERSLAIRRRVLPDGDPRIGMTLVGLAFSNYASGVDSLDLVADSLLAEAALYELAADEEAFRLQIMADVHMDLEDLPGATDLYERSATMFEESLGPHHPEVGRTLLGLGQALRRQELEDSARVAYGRALEIFRRSYGQEHLFVGAALYGLAQSHYAQGHYREALDLAREMERSGGPEGWVPFAGPYMARLIAARSRRRIGDVDEAVQALTAMVRETAGLSRYDRVRGLARVELANAALDSGNPGEAARAFGSLSPQEFAALRPPEREEARATGRRTGSPLPADRDVIGR